MKISRYTAPDMRQALRVVRERLGEDAVILSSRRTDSGVEITAAMDFEAESAVSAAADVPVMAAPPLRASRPAAAAAPPAPPPITAARTAPAAPRPAAASFAAAPAPLISAPPVHAIRSAPLPPPSSIPTVRAAGEASAAVGAELKTLRRMLETQLAQLAWKDLAQRAPVHTEMLRELTEIGLAQTPATEAVARLPPGCDLAQARRLIVRSLAGRVPVTGDQWLDSGGRIALIGPTGVGKTTTLAKLAVRWVLRHGARDLALVAADTVRIGAQDQVRSLGQLLGVPVFAPAQLQDLPATLARLERFRFVLVDTPGAGQRDAQLAQRLEQLAAAGPQLQMTLVLAATTQAGAIEEVVQRFAAARAASCVLTKMDEAASLGGVLSVLMRAQLPVAYVSEGQRVPEDLRPARAEELIAYAATLAKMTGAAADEDLLKRRFGEVAHALA